MKYAYFYLLAYFVLYLFSYGLMSACIFVMYLQCFGNLELFPPVHSIFLQLSCILEFDGACKGNPGKSGAS
jgi:hypothetical protein